MKKTLLTAILTLIGIHTATAQVGIGTEAPDASAQLELQSTTKGFLPPRMTEDDRDQISSPAQGLMIYCSNCGTNGEAQLYNGTEWTTMTGGAAAVFVCGTSNVTFTYNGSSVTYGTIAGTGTNCWLDRNLGATVITSKDRSNYSSQAAYIEAEKASFGDLFQWGRAADGHQLRTSGTTSGAVTSGNEGSNFITNSSSPYDWLKNQDDDRWNTGTESAPIKTANDPCPSGYRVPTKAEWDAELDPSNGITNAQSAFEILKLPMAGFRSSSSGSLFNVGTLGYYWSSTVSGAYSRDLSFNSSDADVITDFRAYGGSVRCLKD